MTVTIQKWGNSQGIRIPKHILEEIKCTDDTLLDMKVENDTIILKKTSPSYPDIDLEKLFSEYHGEKPQDVFDWGEPQGREIW